MRSTRALAQRFELADTLADALCRHVLPRLVRHFPAQQGSDKERAGRMFFPRASDRDTCRLADSKPPVSRRAANPSEAIDEFFLALKAGQVDAAYDDSGEG